MIVTSVRSLIADAPPPPPLPEVLMVLYPINSTISFSKAGEFKTTEEPLIAEYSLPVSLTPLTKTSMKPTL